uniref:Uncharacterized protein n=1 Tax=viral metagenome TaxID=1070528 RepID=A0A6C0J329_9ZZZZ
MYPIFLVILFTSSIIYLFSKSDKSYKSDKSDKSYKSDKSLKNIFNKSKTIIFVISIILLVYTFNNETIKIDKIEKVLPEIYTNRVNF